MNEKGIIFENYNQVVLFACELEGQLSDGFWENAEPEDHWKVMVDKNLYINPNGTVGCVGFVPLFPYNFTDCRLMEIVGQRMIALVQFYNLVSNFPFKYHWDVLGLLDSMKEKEEKKFLVQYPYEEEDLLFDLKRITEIINLPTSIFVPPQAILTRERESYGYYPFE